MVLWQRGYRDSNARTWTYNGTGRREENIKVAMECSYAPYNWTQPMIPTEQFRFPEALITHMATML